MMMTSISSPRLSRMGMALWVVPMEGTKFGYKYVVCGVFILRNQFEIGGLNVAEVTTLISSAWVFATVRSIQVKAAAATCAKFPRQIVFMGSLPYAIYIFLFTILPLLALRKHETLEPG